jgi:hypothetical protein
MNDFLRPASAIPAGRADMAVDAGLRAFMLGVFNKMALGLALSGAIAMGVAMSPEASRFFFTPPMAYLVMFGPIAIMLVASFAMRNPSPTGASLVYWAIVSFFGVSLGGIVTVFAARPDGLADVAKAFFITAASFGALSLWGYTTKKDLTGFGSFLIMGLFGVILASLVNMFMHSGPLGFAITVIGVLVFAGLTAYDTQKLKYQYYQLQGDARSMSVATSYGALNLYLDFINLFLMILRLLSSSRN